MSARKPELLFLCQNLPFPPDGGALIRSFHTLRLLSEEFDVTALCFFRKASRASEEAVRLGKEGLGKLARTVEVFPIPQEESRFRFLIDHLKSILGGRAYTRWAYESREFRNRLEHLVSTRDFSVIHLDSLDLVGYIPALEGHQMVVAHHNVESSLLARRADSEDAFRRRYLYLQARFTAREERTWCPRVALNVAVSNEDQETLASLAPGSRIVVAPNGVDTTAFLPTTQEPDQDIVFVGGHTWFPNRDGMEYFADSILPLIRRTHPRVRVTWVGRAAQPVVEAMAAKGVQMTGYVDDIRPFVARAKCFIVPLRVGGGTRLKILDAWALGKALVSTSAGCEGLIRKDGENLLIADSPQEFASAVGRVLDDENLRRLLERGGRTTVEKHYDWSTIGHSMLKEYRTLIQPSGVSNDRDRPSERSPSSRSSLEAAIRPRGSA
ncbi:glycosyltransferase [soil metagenome]